VSRIDALSTPVVEEGFRDGNNAFTRLHARLVNALSVGIFLSVLAF
jgi:hypothetical protein